MNNLNRIGGVSALLFGFLKIVGLALSTIAFASPPPKSSMSPMSKRGWRSWHHCRRHNGLV